jgi:hypothetical protein
MQRAVGIHDAKKARVIPVLLRPTDWREAPFGKLQVLPANGKPVTTWRNRDEAFLDISRGIRKALEEITCADKFNVYIFPPALPLLISPDSWADRRSRHGRWLHGRRRVREGQLPE